MHFKKYYCPMEISAFWRHTFQTIGFSYINANSLTSYISRSKVLQKKYQYVDAMRFKTYGSPTEVPRF